MRKLVLIFVGTLSFSGMTDGFAPSLRLGLRTQQRLSFLQKNRLGATTLPEVDKPAGITMAPLEAEEENATGPGIPYRQHQDATTLPEAQKPLGITITKAPLEAETATRSGIDYRINQEPPLRLDYQQQEQEQLISMPIVPQKDEDGNNSLEKIAGLGTWITALSSFLLVNNYIGPWPASLLASIPVKAFGLTHAIAGMLFGGGIVLTTLLEWLATGSKNADVLNFYFEKVPKLDAFVVLPALSASIVSGVGLAVDHYDSLGNAPFHIVGGITTLLAFAIWWAVTDVTTQGAAMQAIEEWTNQGRGDGIDIPRIVQLRKLSNVVSCLFVVALYGFMVLKPGFP